MTESKKAIMVYSDWIDKFEELEDVEAGRLIKHFFRYVNGLNPVAPDRTTKLMFIDIENTLIRDLEKWELKSGERSLSGRMGNLKRYNRDLYVQVVENKINIEQAELIAKSRKTSLSDNSDTGGSLGIANLAVSVTDTVSVTVSESDILLEKETKDISNDFQGKKIDFDNLLKFWNKTVSNTNISKINEISNKRKVAVKNLFTTYSKEIFIEVLNDATKSNFLNGNNKSNFSMSFDWFVNKNNFLKVMEGNYRNKELSTHTISTLPKKAQILELTEEEKNEMRKINGLID